MEPKKLYVNWKQFDKDMELFASIIKIAETERGIKFDGIYGPPRGGLCLAVKLSHLLDDLPVLMHPTKNCVICDDVFDSGVTLRPLYEKYCRNNLSIILAWFINSDRLQEVMEKGIHYSQMKENSEWIIYPFEQTIPY